MSKNGGQFVLNPLSNRYVNTSSKTYRRLLKSGEITALEEQPTPSTPPPSPVASPLATPPPPPPIATPQPPVTSEPPLPCAKALVVDHLTSISADHKGELSGLSQKDTETLLRKLLYERLCVSPPEKVKKAKKSKAKAKKVKAKKPKKVKYRMVTPPPSSSEEDSSESESESY